jgi:hypothetical protein
MMDKATWEIKVKQNKNHNYTTLNNATWEIKVKHNKRS